MNTVESNDVFANKWTPMPNMVNYQCFHSSVVVKDKLFVIGQGIKSCEVFDNACNIFFVLKQQLCINYNKSLSIGNRIFINNNNRSSTICLMLIKINGLKNRVK